MPSLSAILAIAGLIGVIGSGAGAWLYRGYVDAGETKAALDARALAEQDAISKAYAKGQQDSAELATAQQQRAQQFEQDLAKEKSDHANDIRVAHLDLARAARGCSVPRADVRVLDAPAAVPGAPATAPSSASGQQRDESGSVDAATIIETCERNRIRFDANLGRLQQCVAAYNDVRAKVSGNEK